MSPIERLSVQHLQDNPLTTWQEIEVFHDPHDRPFQRRWFAPDPKIGHWKETDVRWLASDDYQRWKRSGTYVQRVGCL